MELFGSVNPKEVDEIGDWLHLPAYEIDKIKMSYQNPTQRKEAYLDLYAYQHPCPSWLRVAEVLRYRFSLNRQAKSVEDTYVKGTQDVALLLYSRVNRCISRISAGPLPVLITRPSRAL